MCLPFGRPDALSKGIEIMTESMTASGGSEPGVAPHFSGITSPVSSWRPDVGGTLRPYTRDESCRVQLSRPQGLSAGLRSVSIPNRCGAKATRIGSNRERPERGPQSRLVPAAQTEENRVKVMGF